MSWLCARRLLLGVFVFALVGVADGLALQPKEVDPEVQKSLAKEVIACFQTAERVQVLRVDPKKDQKLKTFKPGLETHVERHAITAKGKEQDKKFASALAENLLKKETFATHLPIADRFNLEPMVAFRLQKDGVTIDVLICFKCSALMVYYEVKLSASISNNETQNKLPDAIHNALLKQAKEAFPDDKAIQAIKDK